MKLLFAGLYHWLVNTGYFIISFESCMKMCTSIGCMKLLWFILFIIFGFLFISSMHGNGIRLMIEKDVNEICDIIKNKKSDEIATDDKEEKNE